MLVAIIGATKLVHSYLIKSPQLTLKNWYSIFQWVAATWKGWKGTRIVVLTMAARWHAPLNKMVPFLNLLVPGRCRCNLKLVIFKLMSRVDILSISCEIALRWMPQDITDDKSTLVQVMGWCLQATSHYLGQCWPISISPYGVARPQMLIILLVFCSDSTRTCRRRFSNLKVSRICQNEK